MILASLGKFAVAQALTAGATDMTNVIEVAALDYTKFSDLWWVVDTAVVAGGAGAITFDLVVSKENTLDTNVKVLTVIAASIADIRVATIGRHIASVNIGKMLVNILDTDDSDYEFIGMIGTLGGSATISIDAVLSPTEPPTEPHRMVVVSNVTVPEVASVGSGF